MFANLTYDDKVAFFDLLDEYFESRPHLLGGSGGGGSSSHVASPVASTSTTGRTLPPMAPAGNGRTLPPIHSPTSPPPRAGSAGGGSFFGNQQSQSTGSGEKPDMATRMIMGGLKMGTSGARTGLGMLSKNQAAMDALGKVGAAAIVNSAHGSLNKAGGPQGQGQGQGQVPSPTSPTAGMGGAVAPPPSRGAPPKRAPVAAPAAMAQARAVYDYEGADASDLTVQTGQVIYVVEKTSEDCEFSPGHTE